MPTSYERFLERLWADVDAGALRPVAAYLAEFPGCEEQIRSEHAGILAGSEATARHAPASDVEQLLGRQRSLGDDAGDPGTQLGPYRLLNRIGSGHFGSVYAAEQQAPVQRKVAIKVLRPGMGSREFLQRFAAERQALALLDHPGVAKVYDAGKTDQGLPFLVMEFVAGEPLHTFLKQHALDLAERIDLFAALCAAVQHAHQKGIIHRDLSSNNVLVALADGKPRPKVIDFGIAKSLTQPLTAGSLHTLAAQVFGTPEFMSPEQARSSGHDIDTRTDVYALGVLFYLLLTDQLPIPSQLLRGVPLTQLPAAIQDHEPIPPSQRVGASGGCVQARELRGDLDWIVLKALEKDRERRYASVAELLADLERYRNHEPVKASPPSTAYRVRKFVRKYRGRVAAVATVVVTALAGAGIAVAYAFESEAQRASAQGNLDRFNLLANVVNLREMKAAEAALHPAFPEQVPAMEGWLAEAVALSQRLPTVQARRDEVLASSLASLAAASRPTSVPASASQPTPREVAERLPRGDPNRFLLETLNRLASDLEAFEHDEVVSVRRRLSEAKQIRKRSIEDHLAEWDAAIAAIATEPKYRGLRIKPQIGLVPIGADRESKLWEFAHLPSGEIAKRHPRTGKLAIKAQSGIVFVLLPAGEFWMGAQKAGQNADPQASTDESPVNKVVLSAFFLGKHELTQGQWLRLTQLENPSAYSAARSSRYTLAHPVELVEWEVCNTWLVRHGLCLPSEAQWEYGCRAGTTTPWWTGEDRESLRTPRLVANLADQTAQREGASWPSISDWPELDDGHGAHAPVGSFIPNAFGLHDMHGNVWEWCRDWYLPYSAPTNPGDGLRLGDPFVNRVGRGGSFADTARAARSAYRFSGAPSLRLHDFGARVSRVITE